MGHLVLHGSLQPSLWVWMAFSSFWIFCLILSKTPCSRGAFNIKTRLAVVFLSETDYCFYVTVSFYVPAALGCWKGKSCPPSPWCRRVAPPLGQCTDSPPCRCLQTSGLQTHVKHTSIDLDAKADEDSSNADCVCKDSRVFFDYRIDRMTPSPNKLFDILRGYHTISVNMRVLQIYAHCTYFSHHQISFASPSEWLTCHLRSWRRCWRIGTIHPPVAWDRWYSVWNRCSNIIGYVLVFSGPRQRMAISLTG